MRSVSFFEKFISDSRISASRSNLLKLPIASVTAPFGSEEYKNKVTSDW